MGPISAEGSVRPNLRFGSAFAEGSVSGFGRSLVFLTKRSNVQTGFHEKTLNSGENKLKARFSFIDINFLALNMYLCTKTLNQFR